jgi:hypothetical protein
MGWFTTGRNSVDIGIRPRGVFKGADVNLYPFTHRGTEWVQQNIITFSQPRWSQEERCLILSVTDSSPIKLDR